MQSSSVSLWPIGFKCKLSASNDALSICNHAAHGGIELAKDKHFAMNQSSTVLKRALLIGSGSHLGGALLAAEGDGLSIDAVPHTVDLESLNCDEYSVVVNMGYDPRYMREPYAEELDFDLAVARRVARSSTHYVMISTRRVYGQPMPFRIDEGCVPQPQDHYGRNKYRTEQQVHELLGPRCTIVRVANVFGFEPGRHTFFGIALDSLKRNNKIVLDVSPFVRRDFIYIDDFARTLRRVLAVRPEGLFNLGSGESTAIGHVALWMIEGYGKGDLVVISPVERDSFELNIDKLMRAIGPMGESMTIRKHCNKIGERLSE